MRSLKSNPLLRLITTYLVDNPEPSNISYLWNYGSLLGTCLIIQIITGIALSMYYSPTLELSFISVEHIMRDVSNGWIIRYLHMNIASFIFIFVYMHIGRGIYYGSYRYPRIIVWYIGIIILITMMATAFLGYVLPYGQMSLWGATVITNLLSAIPFFGEELVQLIWGGYSVSDATIHRFFSLHYLLPFIILLLSLLHLIALHTNGSNNTNGITYLYDRITFNPYFTFKDLVTILLFILILSITLCYYPNVMCHCDNYIPANPMQTPNSIVPEWYLLPFYAILRAIPNKLLGVILMVFAIGILALLPIVDNAYTRSYTFRPAMVIAYFTLVIIFLLLMWIGANHPVDPYVHIGIAATCLYFSWFIIIVPIFSVSDIVIKIIDSPNLFKLLTWPSDI